MLDIGFYEMLVVGIVALIVVGPKDLPRMFKTVGTYVGKARQMARQFQRSMEDAANDAGMGDVADATKSLSEVQKIASAPANAFMKQYDEHLASASTPASKSVAPASDADEPVKAETPEQAAHDPAADDPGAVAEEPVPFRHPSAAKKAEEEVDNADSQEAELKEEKPN